MDDPCPTEPLPGLSRRALLRRMAAAGLTLGALRPDSAPVRAAEPLKENAVPPIPRPLDEDLAGGHVGSLLGPISRIRDAYGWAGESFASDRYRPEEYPAWNRRMRARVFEAMRYAPARADFAPEVVESVDCGTYRREKVYLNTTPELRVPAYVLVPKSHAGKAPGILALHDHGGYYRFGKEKLVKLPDEHPSLTAFKGCYGGRSIADDLAAAGCVVLVADMFYWGERRLRLPDDPPVGPAETDADIRKFNSSRGGLEPLVARTIYTSGFTWAGLIFWDDIRCLDYLAARPEVDESRLGCVGLSVGGWRSAHLAALDERIKAAVVACWLTSFREIQARHTIHTVGFTKLLPGLYRELDMPDVVSLAAPRPLLCINGLKDTLFPVDEGVRAGYRTLEKVYGKIGAADRFRGHLYDTPHEFNAEMQAEAWEWLRKWV